MPKCLLSPIAPGGKVRLTDARAKAPDTWPRGAAANEKLAKLVERLQELQPALYAESKHALLVILQGRDASGKDSTTRNVFGPLNAVGTVVTSFKAPTEYEQARGYLWRIHRAVPPRGAIGVFNRSQYEDVLVVRVRELVPRAIWARRYDQINDFERMLTENGVTILKFMLHVSREEQRERLLARLTDPHKNWKFRLEDLEDRARWDDYTEAYEEALERTSTPWAPWYVVPADRKSTRDLLVAQHVVRALEELDPQFPPADPAVLEQAKRWKESEG